MIESGKTLLFSILLALVWTAAALYATRGVAVAPLPAPTRTYEAHTDRDSYRVQAHSVVQDGFCSVFIRDGERIAAVCGSHTWSVAIEVQ